MGLFSWKTQDTNRSIPCHMSSRDTFLVIMQDDKGNQWHETRYGGYGIFGGMDYYELVATMNKCEADRDAGINLFFGHDTCIFPSLSEHGGYFDGKPPEGCPDQGYFYLGEEGEE